MIFLCYIRTRFARALLSSLNCRIATFACSVAIVVCCNMFALILTRAAIVSSKWWCVYVIVKKLMICTDTKCGIMYCTCVCDYLFTVMPKNGLHLGSMISITIQMTAHCQVPHTQWQTFNCTLKTKCAYKLRNFTCTKSVYSIKNLIHSSIVFKSQF